MGDAFKVSGLFEHVPIAVAILILGWLLVKTVVQILRALEKLIEKVTTSAINTHVLSMHSGDDTFKKDMREGVLLLRKELGELREEHRQSRRRLDAHIDHEEGEES